MTTQSIAVEKLGAHVGAEISGIDLARPLGNKAFREVHDALMNHGVIFFRDQDITPAQHIEFGRKFGELNVHPFAPSLPGHKEILVIRNDKDHPPNINVWHTDVTFMERPAMGSILKAERLPDNGGDTMWASMYAAFEALSDKMQRFLTDLVAYHDFEHVFFSARNKMDPIEKAQAVKKARAEWPLMEHPVVRTHPVTGRQALFVNSSFTLRIKDMKELESRALLQFLYEHVTTPEFQCRFRWRENSIAFWDNRCTQHYALADYWPQERCMHRVTIEGDRPFYRASVK
ncbi:taurine dioxygenase [Parvibaculum sp.]|jgi:taurine dioxygenase|uniref:taurine dioxygenase n=1 Tax=Parvibaculum sp. TaxID=2024848 RepID=UPI000C6B97A3|nr:taurine dioxygenase [Parvibaculum sp.]MAM95210.1 taurine dioxygenase [Parvibaculum sp.]HCX69145.1 taurine dioxygenase [Rhodobiaceae bacterium]|tara:strand:+ start:15424 stop:16287 length:864 start_codon:yes stop_codon:yes gene_type:complete